MEQNYYLRYCLSARISSLRQEAGMTQKQLADTIGVPRSLVASWENQTREPNALHCKYLSEFFGVSIDYLCGNTDQKLGIRAFKPDLRTMALTPEQFQSKVVRYHQLHSAKKSTEKTE